MGKAKKFGTFMLIVSVLLWNSGSLAQDKVKDSIKEPPGWEKGEKEGWTSDIPPGLEKKGKLPPGLTKEKRSKKKDNKATDLSIKEEQKDTKKKVEKPKKKTHGKSKKFKDSSQTEQKKDE